MNVAAILLGLVVIVLGTIGSLLLKRAADTFTIQKPFNLFLLGSGFVYITSTIPFFYALKLADLSFMYPFLSLHYVFASLSGIIFLKEPPTIRKFAGLALILAGVILVGMGK